MITEILKLLNIDSNIEFIKGTSYQLSPEYTKDVYKLNSIIKLNDAKKAGCEVVKQSLNPPMTSLLYPSLQALDEQYLNVNCEACGIDQRKIITFSREILKSIGYTKKRTYLMTGMVSGLRTKENIKEEEKEEAEKTKEEKLEYLELTNIDLPIEYIDTLYEKFKKKNDNIYSEKMSSSNDNSKIDLLDSGTMIKKKINAAYCIPGNIKDNCLLDILKQVIFPILDYQNKPFVINRKDAFGGPLIFNNINTVISDFEKQILHPGDLKLGIIDNVIEIFAPIRQAFSTKEMQTLLKKAY